MARKENDKEISELSFEEAIRKLDGIVQKIEQGEISLQSSIDQYAQGMSLIKHCRKILEQAEMRIEKIGEQEEASEETGEEEKD